jgi:hypothetical protein
MVLNVLIFTFLDNEGLEKRLWPEWQQAFLNFVCS